MLSACTLDNLKMAYQPCENGWRINKMQLHIYVNQLKKQYSSELSHVVTGLLQIPLNSRDKCSQIYCWLAGYEKKILSLETFLPVMKVKKTLVEIEPDKIKENRVNLSVDNRGKGDVRSNNGDFFDNENDDFPTVEKKKMRGTFCHGKY